MRHDRASVLLAVLRSSGDDRLLARIVWQNLHPFLDSDLELSRFLFALGSGNSLKSKPVADLMPRVADRILGRQKFDAQPIGKLFALLRDDHPQVGRQVLEVISAKVQSGELKGEKLDQLKAAMAEPLTPLLADGASHPLGGDAALLAVSWGDPRGLPQVRKTFATRGLPPELRLKALHALISAKDEDLLEILENVLDEFEPEGNKTGSHGTQSKKDGRQYETNERRYAVSTGQVRLTSHDFCLSDCQVCIIEGKSCLKEHEVCLSEHQVCLNEHKVLMSDSQLCLLENGNVAVAEQKNALALEHKAQILAALGKLDDPVSPTSSWLDTRSCSRNFSRRPSNC